MGKILKRGDILEYFIGIISGFLNGVFGMGGGILPLYFLQKNNEDKKIANGTTIFIVLPLSLITFFMYMKNGTIDFGLSLKVCIGATVGGFVGAKLLSKVKYKIILWVYLLINLFAGISMIRG